MKEGILYILGFIRTSDWFIKICTRTTIL